MSLSRQDAAILNIQRACEVAIDIAILVSVIENKLADFEQCARGHCLLDLVCCFSP